MNINGDDVIWRDKLFAITDSRKGYTVYKHIFHENEDGTAFRYWDERFVDKELDKATLYIVTNQ